MVICYAYKVVYSNLGFKTVKWLLENCEIFGSHEEVSAFNHADEDAQESAYQILSRFCVGGIGVGELIDLIYAVEIKKMNHVLLNQLPTF